MKYGIIPDVHDKVDIAQRIMDGEPAVDRWIHLGDYFDSWSGDVRAARHTSNVVRGWLHDPNIIPLLGNPRSELLARGERSVAHMLRVDET